MHHKNYIGTPDPQSDASVDGSSNEPAHHVRSGDVGTVTAAHEILGGQSRKRGLARLLPFMGPAFVASVAYIDPGNFATNIQGGAKYGYMLIWVIIVANLMAMLIQSLSAKLGIATGLNLAETCRQEFRRPVVLSMWVIAEVVAIATDLAEFVGAAIGFNLLFGIPLFPAGVLTGIATFVILGLERRGFRPLEAVITVLVGIIALCYVAEIFMVRPDWGQIGYSVVNPRLSDTESVLLAVGILGATVMPHVIYLHSSLTQNRIKTPDEKQARKLFRFELIDVVVAMGIAGMVNAAMLIMAASTFHAHGLTELGEIEEAYRTLEPLLGSASSTLFGISLLAAGLSSSTVGTMAGQVVMQGFLHYHIPLWLRRGITMLPALIVLAIGLNPTDTLVLSQVVLSFGIPFALIPLVMFTANRRLMRGLTNHRITTLIASVIAGLIVALNFFLLYETLAPMFTGGG